jgi:hypothetical protein
MLHSRGQFPLLYRTAVFKKNSIFPPQVAKIAENSDHNIETRIFTEIHAKPKAAVEAKSSSSSAEAAKESAGVDNKAKKEKSLKDKKRTLKRL